MKLTEFIREQFARSRARRGAAGETLGHEDPEARRLAVYGMVGRSVAPRDIHLTSGAVEFVLRAGNGRLQGATQREGAATLCDLDFSASPAMLIGDREKGEFLRRFIAFIGRPGPVGLRLEALGDVPLAHGLGPEILVGDAKLFEAGPASAPASDGPAPDAEPAAGFAVEPAVEAAPEAAPREAPQATPPAKAAGEPAAVPEAAPDPEPAAALATEATSGADALEIGASAMLSDLARRLAEHVDDMAPHAAGAPGAAEAPFDGIDAFVAEVSPVLGETLLLVYAGGDGAGESLAVAVDNGDAVALQLRRTRLGKVFQEWQTLAGPGS